MKLSKMNANAILALGLLVLMSACRSHEQTESLASVRASSASASTLPDSRWLAECRDRRVSSFEFRGDHFDLRDEYFFDDDCASHRKTFYFSGRYRLSQGKAPRGEESQKPGLREFDLMLDRPTEKGHDHYMGLMLFRPDGRVQMSRLDWEIRAEQITATDATFARQGLETASR